MSKTSNFAYFRRFSPFPTDNRPLLVAGKPETRQYKAMFFMLKIEVGLESAVVTATPSHKSIQTHPERGIVPALFSFKAKRGLCSCTQAQTDFNRQQYAAEYLSNIFVMTQLEFISQLDDMRKRARPLMVFVWVVVIALAAEAFYWLIYYGPQANRAGILISSAIYMIVWGISGGVLVFCLKRHKARYSPKCPTCNKPLTWRERAQMIVS
jgi:hypothetical protein